MHRGERTFKNSFISLYSYFSMNNPSRDFYFKMGRSHIGAVSIATPNTNLFLFFVSCVTVFTVICPLVSGGGICNSRVTSKVNRKDNHCCYLVYTGYNIQMHVHFWTQSKRLSMTVIKTNGVKEHLLWTLNIERLV